MWRFREKNPALLFTVHATAFLLTPVHSGPTEQSDSHPRGSCSGLWRQEHHTCTRPPVQLGGEPQTRGPDLAGAVGAASQKEPTRGACPDGANTPRVWAVSGAWSSLLGQGGQCPQPLAAATGPLFCTGHFPLHLTAMGSPTRLLRARLAPPTVPAQSFSCTSQTRGL